MKASLFFLAGILFMLPLYAHEAGDKELSQEIQQMQRLLNSDALLEITGQLDFLQQELQKSRNNNELLLHEFANMKSRQRELYLDMDRRIQELETNETALSRPVEINQPDDLTSSSSVPELTVKAGAAQQRADYKQAFQLLNNGEYAAAITALEKFLVNHSGSGYAPNAQYWLGEAHYASRDYEKAVQAFRQVEEKYPTSAKSADARLKLGYTYYAMQNWDKARDALQKVLRQHAGTASAVLAEKRLKRMKREGN